MKTQPRRKFSEAMLSDAAEIGTLRRVDADGKPYVEFEGSRGHHVARCTAADVPPAEQCADANVLLVFEKGDRSLPIIIGFIRSTLSQPTARVKSNEAVDAKFSQGLLGNTVVIEGKDGVELRCGQGSISLSADGHIVIKGEKITSRARETNKIRGSTVLIN